MCITNLLLYTMLITQICYFGNSKLYYIKPNNFIQMAQNDFQKNQSSIIRQSQIKMVVEYCRMIGTPMTLKEIVGITNVLVDYCESGYSKEIGERLESIDKHIQKKFEE